MLVFFILHSRLVYSSVWLVVSIHPTVIYMYTYGRKPSVDTPDQYMSPKDDWRLLYGKLLDSAGLRIRSHTYGSWERLRHSKQFQISAVELLTTSTHIHPISNPGYMQISVQFIQLIRLLAVKFATLFYQLLRCLAQWDIISPRFDFCVAYYEIETTVLPIFM
jgi:hypothetical protein